MNFCNTQKISSPLRQCCVQKSHVQHGHTSVYEHSVAVTVECLRIADQFDIAVDRRSLIRGALLHDYFLYDWHSRPKEHRPHGFTHAKTALGNAERDFQINPIEAEMIRCHMFPMNILRIPHHRESIILCLADKTVASRETLNGGITAIKRFGSGIIGTVH